MLRVLLAASVVLAAVPAAAAALAVEGRWLTEDGKAVVEVSPCGGKMCGTVVRVLETDPAVPKTDAHNPDPARRSRPMVGLQVLSGFTHGSEAWTGGRAYDPKSGRSYNATLKLNRDGSLRVTGCVLFVCQSERWSRAR